MTKEELANHIKDLADKHPLGIAGTSIFSVMK